MSTSTLESHSKLKPNILVFLKYDSILKDKEKYYVNDFLPTFFSYDILVVIFYP
jgi:hypothetical protein